MTPAKVPTPADPSLYQGTRSNGFKTTSRLLNMQSPVATTWSWGTGVCKIQASLVSRLTRHATMKSLTWVREWEKPLLFKRDFSPKRSFKVWTLRSLLIRQARLRLGTTSVKVQVNLSNSQITLPTITRLQTNGTSRSWLTRQPVWVLLAQRPSIWWTASNTRKAMATWSMCRRWMGWVRDNWWTISVSWQMGKKTIRLVPKLLRLALEVAVQRQDRLI